MLSRFKYTRVLVQVSVNFRFITPVPASKYFSIANHECRLGCYVKVANIVAVTGTLLLRL